MFLIKYKGKYRNETIKTNNAQRDIEDLVSNRWEDVKSIKIIHRTMNPIKTVLNWKYDANGVYMDYDYYKKLEELNQQAIDICLAQCSGAIPVRPRISG